MYTFPAHCRNSLITLQMYAMFTGSMLSTPCWRLNGVCINHNLCVGFNSLSQVPGCRDKHRVCCFVWNRYNVRDAKEHGINTLGFPWRLQYEIGGKGVIPKEPPLKKKRREKKNRTTQHDDKQKVSIVVIE